MQLKLQDGRDIRAVRKSRQIGLEYLADQLDMPKEALRAIERGKVPVHADTLAAAEKVFAAIDAIAA